MQELLSVPETQLTGESRGGRVLWAPNDAFAQVMGPETRDVQQYTMTPPLSHASDQRVMELEMWVETLTQ
nr:hypothetical protein CFP56_51877 [Quercus suber]